ncbi:hypothetical protein [Noviherbaspirillum pedocola]|nr:hypothetical protein [Noviherbaspirillum pedocola]
MIAATPRTQAQSQDQDAVCGIRRMSAQEDAPGHGLIAAAMPR